MKGSKILISNILMCIVLLNIFSYVVLLNDKEFFESNQFAAELLKGLGIKKMEKKSFHRVPRLTRDSIINQSNLTGVRFSQSQYAVPGWADTRWKFRKNITIDHTKVNGDLTNFPVILDLLDSDLQNEAQASGNDIMFTNEEGVQLDHEIEYYNRVYNATHARLVAWVNTNLSSSIDKIISIYYGNPNAENQENPETVWDSNFAGVWHLNEDPASFPPQIQDSTITTSDGTTYGSMTTSDQVNGIIGDSLNFDGSNDYVNFGNPLELQITGAITVETWFHTDFVGNDYVIAKMGNGGQRGWDISFDDDPGISPDGWVMFRYSVDGTVVKNVGYERVNVSQWYHVVGVFNPSTYARFYLNGQMVDEDTNSIPSSQFDPSVSVRFATRADNTGYFDGFLDEVRISNVVRSTSWIETEYNNQYDPSSFYSVSSEEKNTKVGITPSSEPWYDTTWQFRNKITINHSMVGEFPWFDTNWLYRKKITITSGSAAIPAGSLVNVTFDHSTLVINGKSTANGDDIRVLYWNGITWDELVRTLDPSSSWNTSSTKIWFITQGAISLSTSDDDYYLYYGNALATSPPTKKIFFYDGFESGNFSGWDATSTGSVGDSISTSTDQSNTGTYSAKCVMDSVADPQAMVYEDFPDESNLSARIRIFLDPSLSITDRLTVMQYIDTSTGWQNILSVTIDQDMTLYMWNAIAGEAYGYGGGNTISTGIWHTLEFQAIISNTTGEARLWFDGNIEINSTGINLGTEPIDRFAAGIYWAGDNEPNTLYVDDIWFGSDLWLGTEIASVNTTLGTEMEQSLWNFPVLISRTDNNWKDINNGGYIGQSDGGDIFFTSLAGNKKLAHEIEMYDPVTGQLIVWVNLPALSSEIDTSILMYFGNYATNNQENAYGVWDSNFLAIHHLEENPSGIVFDSTINDADGITNGSMSSGDLVNAWIGQGYDFDGVDDGVMSSASVSISAFTYSAWFKQGPDYSGWRSIVSVGSARQFASNNRRTAFWSGVNPDDFFGNSGDLPEGNWHYGTIIYDGSTYLKAFINGSQVGTIHFKSMSPVVDTFEIGLWRPSNPSDYFDGIIDEVRISNISRSEDWIFTEWKNQLDPSSFYSVGSLQILNSNKWAFPLFKYRKKITINANKVNGSSSWVNFSVLLNLSDSDLHDLSKVQADGDDILFTDCFGTKLDHEIEVFDQIGNGTHAQLIAWVKVPYLSAWRDTNITMYYGNNAVLNQENSTGLWGNDYVGVWHLSESSGNALDSTSYGTQGSLSGGVSQGISGQVNNAYGFNGVDSLVNMGDPGDGHLDFGTGSFTVEVWIYRDSSMTSDQYGGIFKGNGDVDTQAGWLFRFKGSDTVRFSGGDGSASVFNIYKSSTLSDDTWIHLVGVLDRSAGAAYIYKDGQLIATDSSITSGNIDSTRSLKLSEDWSSSFHFKGLFDEIHLSNVARSADWIATEYQNQYDPNSFYYVNSEEVFENWWADSSFSSRKDIVIDHTQFGSMQGDELSSFPFLFEIYDSDLKTQVQSDGDDILFFDVEGRKLDHEIDEFDQGFNSSHAYLLTWINIPQLKLQTDTLFSMYYGNSQISRQENPKAVWNNDYIGIWHLKEVGNGTVGEYLDSTSYNNDGQGGGGTAGQIPAQIDGKIGNAQDFDGIDDDIQIPPSVSIHSPEFELTVSGWLNSLDTSTDGGIIFSDWGYGLDFSDNGIFVHLNGTDNVVWDTGYNVSSDWHYYAFTYDGSVIRLYIDGVEIDNLSNSGDIESSNTVRIGSAPWGSQRTEGIIDEVRISTIQKSGDWINVEFNNQYSPLSSYFIDSPIFYDNSSPMINNFGVDDPGTGTGGFWADVIDTGSGVANVTIKVNGFNYDMSYNGSYWKYQLPSLSFGDNFTYQIINSSDFNGNFLATPSNEKNYSFNFDTIVPTVVDWEYYSSIGENGTFKANVSDSWGGGIDVVIINVTYHQYMNETDLWAIMAINGSEYINDTISMVRGSFDFVITVNDTSSNSFTSITNSGFVANHAPEVSDITLSRDPINHYLLPIYSNSTIYLNYTFYDRDNDSESGSEIRWYKNGVIQSGFNDFKQINSSFLINGDIWNVTIKPRDSQDFGLIQASGSIIIQNTPPTLTNVVILPIVPISTSDLSVSYSFDDTDGDSENNTYREIQWYNSSTHVPAYDNSTVLFSSVTKKGEQWSYKIRCFDSTNYSFWVTSNTVVIGNSPPTASNLTMTSSPQTGDNLVASWDYDDVDGDPENSSAKIRWYKNNILQTALNNSVIVLSGNTSKGEVWHYTVQVFDGQNYSVINTLSPGVQILNTAPTASGIMITPGIPSTNVSLTAEWSFTDVDGDNESSSWIIRWYKDGQYQATYDDQISIPSSATSKGEYWNFTIQVHDGSDYSIQYNSTAILIVNTQPEVTDIAITSNPTSSESLVASWTTTDIDGDNPDNFLNVTIIGWYIWSSGWTLVPSLGNVTVVQSGNLTKNDIWRFELEIFDGEEYSIVYISPNSTILNSPPILTGTPSFNKTTNVSPSDDINITYTYDDIDGDNEIEANRIVYWYKNGQFFSSKTNHTILFNSDTSGGDFWQYIIRVFDGYDYSQNHTSTLVIIGSAANTLPEAQNITLTANSNTTIENLLANYDYYDDDNHLQVDYEILWYIDGELQKNLNNSLTIDSSFTSKHQIWNFIIRVYDGLNWSLSYNSSTLEIQNSIPEASNLQLTSNTTTSVNLTVSWNFGDWDGDSESDFRIKWYIDGVYNSLYDNFTMIDSSNTTKGQVWNFSLQVFDGENYSMLYNSTKTFILNTPPTATNITLTDNPATTDDLVVNWDYNDADGDLENTSWRIRWYRYGVVNESLNDLKTLASGNTSKGEYWYCTIEVFDGETFSIIYQSLSREILNTAPVIQGQVTINSSTPIRGEDLIVEYSFFDIDDDFEYGTIIRWYRNGIMQTSLNNLKIVDGSNVVKDDVWKVLVSGSDGYSFSSPVNSTEITVGNTAPQVDTVEIFPTGKVYTTNTLVANYEASDVDTDQIINISIIWKIGATPVPALENKTEVPANYTNKGQYWTYEIRVFDGTDWSDPKEPAFGIIIDNSKPTITNVVLTGGSNTNEDITLSYDFIDLDNDSEDAGQTVITWYDPSLISGPTGKTLSHTYFVAGDFIFVTLIPHDGEDAGDPIITTVYSSGFILIGNTAPSIVGTPNIYSVNGTSMYSAFSPLFINYTTQDIDNESINVYDIEIDENGLVVGAEYLWYRNNILIVELTESTVSLEYLVKGDKWIASVRPRDRYGAFGDWVNSSEIEIGNTWPQIITFTWNANYPTTQFDLSFDYEYFDYDSDLEWVNRTLIQWFKNGTEIIGARNQSTLSYLQFTKGDEIYTIIHVFDGKNYSLPYQSNQITIQNALPQALTNSLLPSLAYTNNSLTLSWNYFDPDNDTENNKTIIYWYRNGILVPEHTNKSNLEAQYTKKGEIWGATFQVFDGIDNSIVYYTDNIDILNFPITITEVIINGGSNRSFADTNLVINPTQDIITDDPDQDPLVNIVINWYRNNIHQPIFDNQTFIPLSELSKGQKWYANVSVYDGEAWSQFYVSLIIYIINKPPSIANVGFTFDTANSQVEPDIRETVPDLFYVDDEDIVLYYQYLDIDNDLNLTRIQWFRKSLNGSFIEMVQYENYSFISSINTVPGEEWYCQITPYDGYEAGSQLTSSIIVIESRPLIGDPIIIPDPKREGSYDIIVEVTNSRDPVHQVIFYLNLNGSLIDFDYGINEVSNNWSIHFELSDLSLLNSILSIEVKATSKVINSDFEIYNTTFFNLEIIDEVPPRVLNAYFQKNDDLNPTELTFFIVVEEYGLGIDEIILYYCFVPFENGGTGSGFFQEDFDWLSVPLTFESENSSGVYRYITTVEFVHNQQNMDVIYKIQTGDLEGNVNPSAFDIREYPQQMNQQRIYYQPPGLPSWILLVAGLIVVVVFMGAVVYVKFIRKPELVGLDKELVLTSIEKISEPEIMEALDEHTIGIIVSFFDQRHGPIPIIIIPEILKDNFTKLVELSDRSFSGTGFSDDFTVEIPSNYDFVLSHEVRTSVMSFGFALERPDARGGQENLTLNILIHSDLFPLIQSFQKEIQRRVHKLHVLMDKESSDKDNIRKLVFKLRKFVSAIALSYYQIYETMELLEVEE
jgi:hypothetical protein